MKKVIIVRHAKSSWADFSMSDFERPLDKRGLHDAPIMSSRIRASGHIPEIIFSSDAVRAKTTAAFFSKEFDLPLYNVNQLYHGQPDDYMNIIHNTSNEFKSIALFGHNPGITIMANMIKRGCTDNIPTCGVIVAQSKVNNWSEIDWQNLFMVELMFPKDFIHD